MVALHETNATAARSGTGLIHSINASGIKPMWSQNAATTWRFLADVVNPINALRILNSAGGNLLAGDIYLFGQKKGTTGGGGGALTKIETWEATGTETSHTFSSIPQSFEDLVLVVSGRTTAAATFDDVNIRVNGLSTNIYDRQRLIDGPGSANTGDQQLANNSIAACLNVAGASATAGFAAGGTMEIFNYSGTVLNKVYNTQGRNNNNNTTGAQWLIVGTGQIRLTAAITSLTAFLGGSGNFAVGSKITLYGRGGTPTTFGTPFETTAVGTGVSQGVTLPTTGLSPSAVSVFVNGLRYPTSEYSISGATLTLTTNASGDNVAITGFMP
jgi:hypothetical protein